MKLGRNLARTFLDYYKLQNLIIFNPTTSIQPKLTGSNYLKTSNTSQNLSNYNYSNNGSSSAYKDNPNSKDNNNTSSNTLSSKPVSTSRSSKSINQTLKPLSSLNLAGNSTSSLSNNKEAASNIGSSAPQTSAEAPSGNVTFSLN